VALTSEASSVAFDLSSEIGAGRSLPSEVIEGRYRVAGWLGGGGMGDVYEVEHLRLGRLFALKVLRADLARECTLVERFDREARAVAALRSDYVVSIVDAGSLDDGRPFFVMERLQGQDLRQLLTRCPVLPVRRAVNLAIDACLGLHATHAAGLVHRDMKPENLFIARSEDGGDRCKLLDFGVAKRAHHEQTNPGALVGTARYMAPEQVAHDAPVGPPADLFAMGVILYRCLSATNPFEADSLERVLFRIMNDVAAPLDSISPQVPRELAHVIGRALAKNPAERPDGALSLARALLPFAGVARELPAAHVWDLAARRDDEPLGEHETPTDPLPVFPPVAAAGGRDSRARSAGVLVVLSIVVVVGMTMALLVRPRIGNLRSEAAAEAFSSGRVAAPSVAPAPEPLVLAPSPPRAAPATELSSAPMLAAPATPPSSERPTPHLTKPTGKVGGRNVRPAETWFDPRNPYGK